MLSVYRLYETTSVSPQGKLSHTSTKNDSPIPNTNNFNKAANALTNVAKQAVGANVLKQSNPFKHQYKHNNKIPTHEERIAHKVQHSSFT